MSTKRHFITGWQLGILALLASALSMGLNGNGCNLTDDSNSGSSIILIIKANSPTIIRDHDSNPNSEINVPAEAVDSDTEVAFIPFRQTENLPEPLPDGCEFLGGANLTPRHKDKINFHSGKETECYVVLPHGIRAEELSNTDIKLMEFIDNQWVIVLPDKKGKVHTEGPNAGYIGPDESAPAKLTGIRPFCWAIINDPVIIQSLYNLWLTISANSTTENATSIISVPSVNINYPATQPVITPPRAVIVPPAIFAVPDSQVPFQTVLGPGTEIWELDGVGNPFILKEGTTYKMWYNGDNFWPGANGWQNDASIGYAESVDGVNWTKRQRVHVNGNSITDYLFTNDPWIIKEDGIYRMWHSDYYIWVGGDWSFYISHMTSTDGINWANEQTVLTGSGNFSNYDDYCTSEPSVIREPNGAYSMWYIANQRPRVGVCGPSNIVRATSTDGTAWTGKQLTLTRIPGTPEENVVEPNVIRGTDGTYTMYYVNGCPTQLGLSDAIYRAISTDGINWTDRKQILSKTQLNSDILGLGSPHYFKDTDGTEYLYFSFTLPATEKTGFKEYIGRALLKDITSP